MFGFLDRRTDPRSYLAGTATVILQNRKAGDYLVQNVSAGGVLLAGGPAIPQGASVRVLLRLSGVRDLRVRGAVVRRQGQDDADHWLAVRFVRISPVAEDLIRQALLGSLVRSNEPSVLAVGSSIKSLASLMSGLDALERRPILGCTPLDVVRWLSDPDTIVEAALVERVLSFDDGLTVLRFIAREYPAVRRVLVSSELGADELQQYREDRAVDAVLLGPWRSEALAFALGRARSERPAPPTSARQRVGNGAASLFPAG